MKHLLLFLVLLGASCNVRAQGSFATADTMSAGILKTGSISSSSPSHYFKTVLPGSGITRIIATTSNTGSNSGIVRYWLYWKNQSAITYRDVSRGPSSSGTDTFLIGGVAADTVYIRAENWWNGQPFNFNLQYDVQGSDLNNESEPNNTRITAEPIAMNTWKDGHISFSSTTGTDVDDYFRIIFPRSGTLRIYTKTRLLSVGGSSPGPLVYILDKNGNAMSFFRSVGGAAGSQNIAGLYAPMLTTGTDTFSVYGRAEDTMYVRINNYHYGLGWAYSSSYSLNWSIIDTTSNNEGSPNETIAQAPLIAEGATVNGSISYVNGSGTDLDDYYRIVLAKDATITLYASSTNTMNRQANPAPIIYVLEKSGNALTVRNNAGAQSGSLRVANNGAVPFLATVRDTMNVYGRAKDTFLIRVNNFHYGLGWPWSAHYTLRYQLTDTAAYNEKEPNHSRATAHHVNPGDTVRGNVSYASQATGQDVDDYYRIVKPAGGAIKLYIKARNTWGYQSDSWAPGVWAQDKNGNPILLKSATTSSLSNGVRVRNNYTVPYGATVTDTILIPCISSDTMYVVLQNYFNVFYGGWSATYEFRYEYLPPAKSGLAYARMGNEFGFINQATNASSYLWLMGNGQQYTSFNAPLTTYGPGNYDVKLVARDNLCNYRDTAKVNITVAGIEYYTPKRAGKGGDAIIQVYGGALDTGTIVQLIRGPKVLTPRTKYTNARKNHLTADFDLHFADTGFYDVVLQVPGQPSITYPNGFYIEGFKYPFPWSQVVGPSRMRPGVDNRFSLLVGNNGNVTANGVVVAMLWPKNVTIDWKAKFHKPDYTKSDTLVVDTATYVFPNTIFRHIYDSLVTTTPIDSFEGKPYNGYMRFIYVPHVPANKTIEIGFTAKAANPALTRFITYAHWPNMFGSCGNESYEDMMNNMSGELVDAADMLADKSKMPFLIAFTKSVKVGQKHMQSAASYLGKEFWSWYDGYETDHDANMADWLNETDANNQYALETFAKEAGGMALNGGIAKLGEPRALLQNRIDAVNKLLANNPNMSAKNFDKAMDFLNKHGKALSDIDRINRMKGLFDEVKNAADLSEKLLRLQQLVADCPELQEQLDELRDLLDQELDHQDPQNTDVDTRTSFDPNAIYGPSGIDAPRFINNFKRQPFLIAFENVDTAGADAQDVIIRDTINKAHFDISSVEFGDILVANQLIRIPKGRPQFVVDKQLSNRPGITLRVMGNIDTAAGVITWHFISIDSVTRNKPLLDGFLRPNITKPEGEGSVSYIISPHTNLADGTVLSSKATIIFDDNAPIATDVWSNKMDIAPPNSSITSGLLRQDTVVRLNLAGADASSGIRSYTVHYSTNNGPWRTLGRSATDSLIFVGQHDSSYRFYATAVDNVGNAETKIPIAEYTVTIPTSVEGKQLAVQGASLSMYPNPATGKVTLKVSVKNASEISLNLQNVIGQQGTLVYTGRISGTFNKQIDVSQLPAGVYLVQLKVNGRTSSTARLVVVH